MNTTSKGTLGENIVCDYLQNKGYEIIKRNYRIKTGEIDIIAKKGSRISFVEVKTRKDDKFGRGADAVNYYKRQKIIRTAQAFLLKYNDYEEISFDVCEVYTEKRIINYIESAFDT